MKTILTFLILWIVFTLVVICVNSLSKSDKFSLLISLLFGLGTATIASVVLFVIVYLF